MDSIPRVPRVSPRGEEAGPARDELRVPGEEEDGEDAEQDEHGLFGKPATQRCDHHGDLGLWPDSSKGSLGRQASPAVTGPRPCLQEPEAAVGSAGISSSGDDLSIGPASLQTLHIIPRVLGTLQREKESETESEKQRNETDGNREVGKRGTVIYPEWDRYERDARGEGGRQRQKRGSPDVGVKIYPVRLFHRPGSRAQRGLG